MRFKLCLILAVAVASLCGGAPAQAQKMYRCGSVYQDRPCSGGQEGKVIGGSGAATPAGAATSSVEADANCSQRGSAAQKIKWTREAGKTEEQQLAAASRDTDRELIADVYRRQGTSGQVRTAVEADCMAEKERAAQAAALIEAANRLPGKAGSGASTSASRPAK